MDVICIRRWRREMNKKNLIIAGAIGAALSIAAAMARRMVS